MALAEWPEAVPYALLVGSGAPVQPFALPAVTPMEDGPERMRRRSHTRIQRLAYAIPMSEAEFATFDAFAWGTLGGGSAHFRMPVLVPGAGAYVSRRVYLEKGQFQAPRHGTGRLVTFTLAVFPS